MIAPSVALVGLIAAGAAQVPAANEIELRNVEGKWLGHDDEAGETPVVTGVVRNTTANRCLSSAIAHVIFFGPGNQRLLEQNTELLVNTIHYKPLGTAVQLGMDFEQVHVVLPPNKAHRFTIIARRQLPQWKQGSVS